MSRDFRDVTRSFKGVLGGFGGVSRVLLGEVPRGFRELPCDSRGFSLYDCSKVVHVVLREL